MRFASFELRWSLLGATLAFICLVVSLIALGQHYEGSWGGFVVFQINFPISLVPLVLGNLLGLDQVPFIICAGIAQWYVVGSFIESAIKRVNSQGAQ
jgi:hypothetical protein